MCGIAGYLSSDPLPEEVLSSMVEALYHRGPDAVGYYHDNDYHAGMRRLSINDVEGGNQPLSNLNNDVILFYNGEIYNSPELRRELISQGVQFRTRSDGEVICHLYEREGESCIERLDGMFALALWDARRKRLILARDIPGEKPLYYTQPKSGCLVFASELKSLTRFPSLNLKLKLQALWDFPTFLWIPEPATIYEDVYALPPGYMLIADENGVRIKPYANKFYNGIQSNGDRAIISETHRLVEDAVRSRLLSDVSVGCSLSSGLDSSIIATVAAQNLSELTTFTVGFEDVEDPYHGHSDESPAVEDFARKLGTRHYTVKVTADDFRRDLDIFTLHGDQPFAVSSGLGILSIARAAHEKGIKVLLSGDGADEVFGGYSWYEHLEKISNQLGSTTAASNGDISMQFTGLSNRDILTAIESYSYPKRAWAWHYYASEKDKFELYSPDISEKIVSSLNHFHDFRNGGSWTSKDYIRQDRLFYFPNEMLRKIDRMTMAMSVEGRVPFAAPALQSFSDNLKYDYMVRGKTLKWALREAFRDMLPSEVTNRPKHGFNVPIDHWLKGSWADLVDETFAPSSALARMQIIRPNAGLTAKKMLDDRQRLTGHTIFCFIQLNSWLEQSNGVSL